MLVVELATTDADDTHKSDLDKLVGRSNAGQHPIDAGVVTELYHHLIDDPIRADGPRD